MKDGFMILVLILVMITPMFPFLLKSKCPNCKKRKLEHLDTEQRGDGKKRTYITNYHCHACGEDFEQNKSGPLVPIKKQELLTEEQASTKSEEPVLAKTV